MRPRQFRLPAFAPRARAAGTKSVKTLVERHGFGANPGALRMFLYAPASLPKKAPLVVILHGCTQSAAGYDEGTGWSALAAIAGFAVLAPEQTRENNVNGCFNWFQPADTARGEGEAASIRQMIEHAITTHDLDRKRVFITGLSAGGAMAAAMLGAYPEIFAGGGIIAGLAPGAASNVVEALGSMRHAPDHSPSQWAAQVRRLSGHQGPWPRISIWQGDGDAIVHPSNAQALIAQWTALHGVGPAPSSDIAEGGLRRRCWNGEDGRCLVEAIDLAAMGHGAPVGGPDSPAGKAGPYFLDVGISSTLRLAAFWGIAQGGASRHSRARDNGIGGTILKALQSAGLWQAGRGNGPT